MTDLHAPRPCEMCGKTFQPSTKGKQPVAVYCSRHCRDARGKLVYEAGCKVVDAMPIEARQAWAQALKD